MSQMQAQALNSLFFGDVEQPRGDSSLDLSFRRVFVDISKLLVERWLQTERGKEFAHDVDDPSMGNSPPERLKRALEKQGISLATWVTPEADVDSYNGSIVCNESQDSLAFTWKIPYADRPSEIAVPEDVLWKWVETCEKWLSDKKYQTEEPFPAAPNHFIPLATT